MPSWDYTPNTDHHSKALRDYYDSRTDEEIEANRKRMQEMAILRHARNRLNPESPESRGHRFQKGNTYGVGQGKHNEEGMLVARTLKQLAYQCYQNNQQMIYDALVAGIQAEPPRSLPYLMLLLKVESDIEQNPGTVNAGWVSHLTTEEHQRLRAIMQSPELQQIMSAAKARMAAHPHSPQDIVLDVPAQVGQGGSSE
jgi:hypothetical protein